MATKGYSSSRGMSSSRGGRTITRPHSSTRRADTGSKLGRPATPSETNMIVDSNRESGPRLRHPKG